MESKILQLDDDLNIIKKWSSVKEIAESLEFKKQRTSFDQAIRKLIKAHGFYWMLEDDFQRGMRPDFSRQIRNKIIYTYLPEKNEETKYTFVSAYKNAVIAADDLGISVSNIRCVCKGEKGVHKGYYFSYSPLNPEDEILGEVQIIEKRLLEGDGDYEYWERELKKAKKRVKEFNIKNN